MADLSSLWGFWGMSATHLLNVAFHERATEHGSHPVAAGDEQGLMGWETAIIQTEHHI